jgi:hypothetical protein
MVAHNKMGAPALIQKEVWSLMTTCGYDHEWFGHPAFAALALALGVDGISSSVGRTESRLEAVPISSALHKPQQNIIVL